MSSFGWMLVAFGCVGAGIAGYLVSLLVRERRLEGHLKALHLNTPRRPTDR